MKTLLMKFKIAQEACRESLYYEVLEHNGKKFQIKYESMNGNYIGFNHACCLKVLGDDGVWKNVVDNQQLGFSSHNDDVYYGTIYEAKEKHILDCVEEFKNYIVAVY